MKKLCRILSTALCMALVISQCTVYAAISSDAADKNSTAESYVYDDFNSAPEDTKAYGNNGNLYETNSPFYNQKGAIYEFDKHSDKGIMYYRPMGWATQYAVSNTNGDYKIGWFGNDDDGFFAYSGRKINSSNANDRVWPIMGRANVWANNADLFATKNQILNVDLENEDVLVSYDYLINSEPYTRTDGTESGHISSQPLLIMRYNTDAAPMSILGVSFAYMPTVFSRLSDGKVVANIFQYGRSYSGALYSSPKQFVLNDCEKGEWVNVATAISKSDGCYVFRHFVNGKFIQQVEYDPMKVTGSYDKQKQASWNTLGLSFQLNGFTVDGAYQGIDNFNMRKIGNTKIDSTIAVGSNEKELKVDVINEKFAGSDIAPNEVKKGIADVSNASVSAYLYSSDDVFKTNGQKVNDIIVEFPEKTEKEVIYPEGRTYTVNTNGTEFVIKNLPEISENDILLVRISGISDARGDDRTYSAILYNESNANVGFYEINFENYLGDAVAPVEKDGKYVISSHTKKAVFRSLDTNDQIVAINKDGSPVMTADFVNGDYVFDFDKFLVNDSDYTVTYGGNEICSFTTDRPSVDFFADSENGVNFTYANSYADEKEVYFVTAGYNADGNFEECVSDVQTLPGSTYGIYKTSQTMNTHNTYKGFLYLAEELEEAVKNTTHFSTEPFDDNSVTHISGNFSGENTQTEADLLVVNSEGKVVIADIIALDKNGDYSYDADFGMFAGGKYTFYLRFGNEMYINALTFVRPEEIPTELEKVLKAANPQEIQDYIETSGYKLNLESELYELVDKSAVASALYNRINDANAEKITTKGQLAEVFKLFVVIQGFNENKIDSISNYAADISCLSTFPFSKWFAYNIDKVTKEKTDLWRSFMTTQLNGSSITDADDFKAKLSISIVFASVNNRQSVDSLVELLGDFADIVGLEKSNIDADVVSKLTGSYSGFDIEKLKDDMARLRKSNDYTGGGGKGGSGSGGHTLSMGNVTVPSTPDVPKTNDIFSDIGDCSWAKEAIEELYKKNIVSGIGNNLFNPHGAVLREEFVKMTSVLLNLELNEESESVFADINKDSWYAKYINAAYKNGIIGGISDSEFGVGNKITRQDIAVIIMRALKNKIAEVDETSLEFTDADSISDYAKEAVKTLCTLKVLNGYEDGTFRPTGFATRAETAKIIYSVMKYFN